MKRLTALLLALCMMLTLAACASEEETPAGQGEGIFYEITGLDPEAVMLTVDGREVTNRMYFYWLAYTMSSITSSVPDWVDDAGLLKWDEEVTEGQTVEDLVRQEALNTAKMYMVVENWSEEYGITLTDDDKAIIDQDLDSYAEQLGGQEMYEAYLWDQGLTDELNRRFSYDYYTYSEFHDATMEPGSPLYITDDVLYQYEEITPDTVLADHILLTKGDDAEANMEAYAAMEQILEMLDQAGDSAPSVFSYIADQVSQDPGRSYYPNGYLVTEDADFLPEFKEAALALEENQYSGIVETDAGYHIILRRPIRQYVADQYLSDLISVAMDNAEMTYSDAYNTLDIRQFQIDYQTYTALHSAVRELTEAEETEETDDTADIADTGTTDTSGTTDTADTAGTADAGDTQA